MNREENLNLKNNAEPIDSTVEVARRILKMDGNTVRLSLASLFCALCGVLVFVVSFWPVSLFTEEEMLTGSIEYAVASAFCALVFLLLLVFVFLPSVSGVVYFAKMTVDGEHPALIELLAPFRNRKLYFRSIAMPMAIFLRMLIILLPLLGGLNNIYRNFGTLSVFETVADIAFVFCLTLLAVGVGAYISSYFFFAPYLMISQGKGFFASLALSVRFSRKRRAEIARMTMSHTKDVVLSVISFFVLWVILAAPRMSVSYFVYCNSVFADGNLSIDE